MGVLNFDPDTWQGDENATGEPAKAAIPAKMGTGEGQLSQLSQLSQPLALPNELVEGLSALREMPVPAPARSLPQEWHRITEDALWLWREGWAAQALSLGWEPLHLFGIKPDLASDARPGLAVRLFGHRKVMLAADHAIIVAGERDRINFDVRDPAGAILLWELE